MAYFTWLSKRLGGGVALKPVRRRPAPEQVLDLAVRRRAADRKTASEADDPDDVYDGVWIVVDVDEHAYLARALADARKEGIDSAVSGPCFEVWLVLHVEDCRAAYITAKKAKAHWAVVNQQARTFEQKFEHTAGHLALAVDRAEALSAGHDEAGTPRHRRDPSTEVGRLVAAVVAAADRDLQSL